VPKLESKVVVIVTQTNIPYCSFYIGRM